METLIVGNGGHALDIASWTGFGTVRHHSQVLSSPVILGMNDPWLRARIAHDLRDVRAAEAAVHPSSVVGPGCWLSSGVVIGPLSSLVTGVVLGRHTHIGAGCHITRAVVGDFVTVAPGVTICGDVMIGHRVMIGAGATIKNFVTIGDDVMIGAGAAVVSNIPNGVTVKGVPAR